MKAVVCQSCRQTLSLRQWQGFGRLVSNRLSKDVKGGNVNMTPQSAHARHLRTLSRHSAEASAPLCTAIESFSDIKTLTARDIVATRPDTRLNGAQVFATHRLSGRPPKHEAIEQPHSRLWTISNDLFLYYSHAKDRTDLSAVFNMPASIHINLDDYSEDEGSRSVSVETVDLTEDDTVDDVLPRITPQAAQDFEHARLQHDAQFGNYRFLRSVRGQFDLLIKPGIRVQLKPNATNEIHFLHVAHILQMQNGSIELRGISLKRHWYIYPGKREIAFLPRSKNDLCMDLKTTPDKLADPSDWSSMISVPLAHVDVARDIVFTNFDFKELSYQHRGMSTRAQGYAQVEETGLLCVRWKYAKEIENGKVIGMQAVPLQQSECDEGYGRPSVLKLRFFGKSKKTAGTMYTLGDGCAGGGLILRAFKMAGGKVAWAIDIQPTCARTLRLNFPETLVIKGDIRDFAEKTCADEDYAVDILHISFPCQGHSLRNKGTNPDRDMENNETILSLEALLKHVRPRIVTLEQTDGIMSKNGGWWYSKLLSILAEAGYAIRTRRINMAEYKNPQARHRLMIYASCPGQKLPDWPQPTNGPGLNDYRTIRQAIRDIPANDPFHDVEGHKDRFRRIPRNLPVADMDQPLATLIDTAGAGVLFRDTDGLLYWPTFRQQMRLQTVPDEHVFAGDTQKEQTTQNGNGVPCAFGKVFFKTAIKALRESDREADEWYSEIMEID